MIVGNLSDLRTHSENLTEDLNAGFVFLVVAQDVRVKILGYRWLCSVMGVVCFGCVGYTNCYR